jgi:dihydroneopterin aldolase
MTDRIELRGLRVRALVGVLPEERERVQPLEIDLDLHIDIDAAARSDDLADTVDYGAVCADVEALCASLRPQLLEVLAARIASVVLDRTGVAAVDVAVRKLRPPVPQDLATCGVRIHRAAAGVPGAAGATP